jgi:hypothetical protein
MTALEVLLAVAGSTVTVIVVVAMVLITPRGEVDLHDGVIDPQGSDLSRADMALPSSAQRDHRALPEPTRNR